MRIIWDMKNYVTLLPVPLCTPSSAPETTTDLPRWMRIYLHYSVCQSTGFSRVWYMCKLLCLSHSQPTSLRMSVTRVSIISASRRRLCMKLNFYEFRGKSCMKFKNTRCKLFYCSLEAFYWFNFVSFPIFRVVYSPTATLHTSMTRGA